MNESNFDEFARAQYENDLTHTQFVELLVIAIDLIKIPKEIIAVISRVA
jgi:hypothetical protein